MSMMKVRERLVINGAVVGMDRDVQSAGGGAGGDEQNCSGKAVGRTELTEALVNYVPMIRHLFFFLRNDNFGEIY
jgi:hypothetical protein